MSGRGGGAYVNGRYVPAGKAAGKGGGGGGRGREANGRSTGWSNKEGGENKTWERKPGDEDVALERKFDIEILQPGEVRTGYLFNMKQSRHYDENGRNLTGMLLYFLHRDGRTFRCTFLYRPYFFVQVSGREGLEKMKDILAQRFANDGVFAEIVEKEDLNLEDHIVGRSRKLIKLSFTHFEVMNKARLNLQAEMRQRRKGEAFSFDSPDKKDKGSGSAIDSVEELYEYDIDYVNRVCIDNGINCGKWFRVERNQMATSADDIWDTQTKLTALNEMTARPGLRIFAWDIECTKEPLKFPDSAHDRITLISVMVDGSGFLIVNRAEVSQDIEPLEYTPKPEYEGIFQTYNEQDEGALLRRFFQLIRDTNPHVMVSYNGDFFDYPFVTNRAKAHGMDWVAENGIDKPQGQDCYAGKWLVHLDCFNWVQRDSYLPCGARGLKAVTRYKLKYDPVELDPEDMTPYAKERPQELAAYSVSDAVATYYLYMKYIHDFIFALCSIIPYGPDDVLRKGSGTLCESLLMTQAYQARVVFPNKHMDEALVYHESTNRLIEQSSYEGARVECMRVGVYRADIKETFQLEPSAFQTLLHDLKATVDFFLVVEEKVKLEDVENYAQVLEEMERCLRDLCDPDKVAAQIGRDSSSPTKPSPQKSQTDRYVLKLVEYEVIEGKGGVKSGGKKVRKASYRVMKDDYPLIYHLDVGAMYPNIILSNRLQPSAIVTKEFCNACTYNDPVHNCKREMDWKWRGDLYMATRADVRSIMNEMENEKRRYNRKDRESGEMVRVKWNELGEKEQVAEITKAVREFSQKAYRRVKSSVYEDKTDTVCQRENPFYVDTVRAFRDRRYKFKGLVKQWTKKLEAAEEGGNALAKMEAKDNVLLYDSLQLAHKCILNSFYGYVMRKGARWHSMKMAGIVTYTGSNLIREAREFCEQVGLPLELDTDGIWCLLPKSFPDTYKFKLKSGKELKMPYPNSVLNYRVHQKYTNHQYQDRTATGEWKTSSENSIFFEIDGPYKAMILPASTEEDKMLKKRYAVFNFDGSLAELKGFEVKRRGELRLIQIFQTEVFPEFLKGSSKQEVYNIVGNMANRWLDVIDSRGRTMTDDEVIYFISESKSMSKSVEASGNNKSVQITTARRLAAFLGLDSMLKDDGLSCHLLIANKPDGASCTERAIPVKIFSAEYEVKKTWLRQWLQDPNLSDTDMRSIIDWDYYRDRLCAVLQKLICIPAAYQNIPNPCPRVKVPEWLRKRLAEQNDKYQQRSLGLWVRKAGDAGGPEAAKRKLVDMEDLAGAPPGVDLALAGQRWVEAQQLRWAAEADKENAPPGAGDKQTSLFNYSAGWAPVSPEALRATWHIVGVELSQVARHTSALRLGDFVLVDESIEGPEPFQDDEEITTHRGKVIGFVGGLVRVCLEDGEEQLVKAGKVRPMKEPGLFTLWVATGRGLNLHRCEFLAHRRVVLALESDFTPESTRCGIRPGELTKGMRVWPRAGNDREGPGTINDAVPGIGLCTVTWADGMVEAAFSGDLERQGTNAVRVLRDAPRNMQHPCLVELDLGEEDFQQQRDEGIFSDRDVGWPRIDSVYEAEQPLEFDIICRLGPTVKLTAPDQTKDVKGQGLVRFVAEDLMQVPCKDYLDGMGPGSNIYLHLCFDRTRPSRAFCGLYSPALAQAWVCFGGLDPNEGQAMRPALEQLLSERLAKAGDGAATNADGKEGVSPLVQAEVTFVSGKSLNAIAQWIDQKLQAVREKDGGSVCVLCSQLPTNELRGISPSFWIEQRHLRGLTMLSEIPICRAPFAEGDAQFPALDWQRWISQRFAGKIPQLFGWWRHRLALCRAAGLPICNAPEIPNAMVPAALDAMFARQLQRDSQLRWASVTTRPDLGETASVVDAQEDNIEAVSWILQGKDRLGQINRPGVYRSVCLELNLRTKLCVCALQHARMLSDMEGGELSRKMIRKVATAGEATTRNLDHTSEVSVTSFESLVTMVQDIATAKSAKEKEIVGLRQSWAAQSPAARLAVKEAHVCLDLALDDDSAFIEAMEKAGLADTRLAAKLEELRAEHDARSKLLDGLCGWLSSSKSLLYDPALLRKVHQYMDRVLQQFVTVLKKNGCSVIHASYSKVLFATGKLQVLPDVPNFWQALCDNIQTARALEPLALRDAQCLTAYFYGVMWLDPANWAGVPIDEMTGEIKWKVRSNWKMVEFLPPAVRPSLILYVGDLLLVPQRELGKRCKASTGPGPEEESARKCDDIMDVDDVGGDCLDREDELADDEDAAAQADGEFAAAAAAAANPKGGEAETAGEGVKAQEVLEEVRNFIRGDFFDDLRRRVLDYVSDIQSQQQRELPAAAGHAACLPCGVDTDSSDESADQDDDEERKPAARARKMERLRKHFERKWGFPTISGRRFPPGAVDVEFMRTLVQILQLEECLEDQVMALRDRLCQKLRVSSFGMDVNFENPGFPLILREVVCSWCGVSSPVDVTSHPTRGPGLWVCPTCERTYDKDAMQGRLVALLEDAVQAWQSQEIVCKKCRKLQTSHIQSFCECYGRYEVRFAAEDCRLVIQLLQSLVEPHGLPWLGQMLDFYNKFV